MKKKVGVRVLSLLLSCVLLGTMLPAAVASADPAPTYSIKVEPSSIDLVEGESLPLKAIVTSDTGPLDEDGLKGAGLSIRWESGDIGRVSVEQQAP